MVAATMLKCKDADDVDDEAKNRHNEQSLMMHFWRLKQALQHEHKTTSKQTNNKHPLLNWPTSLLIKG